MPNPFRKPKKVPQQPQPRPVSPTPQAPQPPQQKPPAQPASQTPPQARPQAPVPQRPQTPAPPVAPKAPPGKIEREKKMMKLSCARRAQFLKYLLGLILLGAGGYVYLFRPLELNIVSAFVSIDYIAAALALLGIIVILYAEAKERGAHYYITQYRVVEIWGLLRKREHALQLLQIESVKIRQTFFERILGIGDVELKTARDSLMLHKVGNPEKVESLILSELNRPRNVQPV
jgi:hypothetical protein